MNIQKIIKWLLDDRIITRPIYDDLIRRFATANSDIHPLVRLGKAGFKTHQNNTMNVEQLTEYVAGRMSLPYTKIDPLKVDTSSAAAVMSQKFAQNYKILPLAMDAKTIRVAVADTEKTQWIDALQKQHQREVIVVLANPLDIEKYTIEFFNIAKSVKEARRNNNVNTFEQLVDIKGDVDANDQGIVQLVDWMWQYAFEQKASDIHLEPRRDTAVLRFRIDGKLHPVHKVPPTVLSAMVARIKSLGRMDVVERRRPQDGRIKTRGAFGEIEMRLSTLPTAFGEKMVLRIFDPLVAVRTPQELGFPYQEAAIWQELTSASHGIVLVTGPTGSGKTTTLYATLKRLAREDINVNTIEDPIEMVEPGFNQTQVQPQIDFSFAEGLRALMRQDPDVIMVGEIRDLETAQMAIQAALTGHLVFSTMHTNDAPSAITRLMELGVPSYLLNATLTGVLAQRLVRVLCPTCKRPSSDIHKDQGFFTKLLAPWSPPDQMSLYEPVGCEVCRNTGFKGRLGVYELMRMSPSLNDMLHQVPDVTRIRQFCAKEGMRPLRVAAMGLVYQGLTTVEEVLDATPDLRAFQGSA